MGKRNAGHKPHQSIAFQCGNPAGRGRGDMASESNTKSRGASGEGSAREMRAQYAWRKGLEQGGERAGKQKEGRTVTSREIVSARGAPHRKGPI